MCVQAPFVLENLGCSGDEGRLVDCPPQAMPESTRGRNAGCTPFEDHYVFVVCGATSGPGAAPPPAVAGPPHPGRIPAGSDHVWPHLNRPRPATLQAVLIGTFAVTAKFLNIFLDC